MTTQLSYAGWFGKTVVIGEKRDGEVSPPPARDKAVSKDGSAKDGAVTHPGGASETQTYADV